MKRIGLALTLSLLLAGPSQAYDPASVCFGGNGADGPLAITTNTTATNPIVGQYTTYSVSAGVTHTIPSSNIICSGAVSIAGTLTCTGSLGGPSQGGAGAGELEWETSNSPDSIYEWGACGGGGGGFAGAGGYGGAGANVSYNGGAGGRAVSFTMALGSSGGAGGLGADSVSNIAQGGTPGGTLRIIANGPITVSGAVHCDGTNGQNGPNTAGGSGDGGGGGASGGICLLCSRTSLSVATGTFTANGGNGGNGGSVSSPGAGAGTGAGGAGGYPLVGVAPSISSSGVTTSATGGSAGASYGSSVGAAGAPIIAAAKVGTAGAAGSAPILITATPTYPLIALLEQYGGWFAQMETPSNGEIRLTGRQAAQALCALDRANGDKLIAQANALRSEYGMTQIASR